ncbi:hypothetical protein [Nonomuraea maheshkhaliensis]
MAEVLLGMLDGAPDLDAARRGQTVIGDMHCFGATFGHLPARL